MEPQAPVSMQLVRQALLARAQGMPQAMTQQQTVPQGTLPTGGQNTPTIPQMPMPNTPQQNLGAPQGQQPVDPVQVAAAQKQKSANALLKSAVHMIGQGVDPQTSALSKALITNLLKYHQ